MLTELHQSLNVLGLGHLMPDPAMLQTYAALGLGGLSLTAVGVGLMRRRLGSPPASSQGHGSAHFATAAELRRRGLHRGTGIYVGRSHGYDLRVPRSHLMIIGPSECGKTLSMGLGTEIEWPGSVLTLDLKGEHLRLSAPYRKARGNDVHVFEPRHRASGHLNLLDQVPFGDETEVAAVQRISDHLTDLGDAPASGGVLFYRANDRALLEAVMLYLGNYEPPVSFAKVRARMGDLAGCLEAMVQVDHPLVAPVARELKGLPLPKRSELWKSARERLRVFDDPILARNTDDTTIPLDELQHGERPQTVYVRVTPDDARGSLRGIVRLLLDQHLATAGQRRVTGQFRWHELLNLDDQFELGYLAAADHTGAFYREYGLWLMSTFQSFEQLGAYGSYASLLDNSKTWVCFRPRHTASAKRLSEKLGVTTVREMRTTRGQQGMSRTEVSHARPLMTPDEVEQIPDYHALVFTAGCPAIMAQQVLYTERPLC